MPETVRRAQALTCELMAKYGIPLENVVRHYDVTHKNCPAPFVESASAWTAFKQGLQKKEEPDMTEAEVKKIIESTRRTYNSVSAVPAWAKPTVEKLTRKGWLPDRRAAPHAGYQRPRRHLRRISAKEAVN